MILPSRPPQERKSYHLGMSYNDHETAVQEDGRIAAFHYNSDEHAKGWQFQGYKDKYGFSFWDDETRARIWDDDLTIQSLLLTHCISFTTYDIQEQLGPDFRLEDDEVLHAYQYGGVLSMRGGWFVVKKNDPNKILRTKMTRMS